MNKQIMTEDSIFIVRVYTCAYAAAALGVVIFLVIQDVSSNKVIYPAIAFEFFMFMAFWAFTLKPEKQSRIERVQQLRRLRRDRC